MSIWFQKLMSFTQLFIHKRMKRSDDLKEALYCTSYHILFHFITFHHISYHFISFHIISYHFISFRIISYHVISFHIISYHFISFHIISYHFISFHIISYHFISFHIISYHFISFYNFISFLESRLVNQTILVIAAGAYQLQSFGLMISKRNHTLVSIKLFSYKQETQHCWLNTALLLYLSVLKTDGPKDMTYIYIYTWLHAYIYVWKYIYIQYLIYIYITYW